MTNQRVDEWRVLDSRALEYHESQWVTVKESTKAFSEFIHDRVQNESRIVDLACGAGAATAHLAIAHPDAHFVGLDISEELIRIAQTLASKQGIANLSFEIADLYELPAKKSTTGVISLQTLSWLPEAKEPLSQIFQKLKPRWVGLSSLFYEGDISCTIEVTEHQRSRRTFYNCYSIPEIQRICNEFGYNLSRVKPFEIQIDLPTPVDINFMGTRTVSVLAEDGTHRRLQISGPLLMNWHFLLLERIL